MGCLRVAHSFILTIITKSIFMKKTFITTLLLLCLPLLAHSADDLEQNLYYYKANVVSVYDGDTITADIDLGFHTWIHGEKLRLARIDAPEMRGKEKAAGKVSRDWLRRQILDKDIIIHTQKKKNGGEQQGKYGRYIVELYLDGVNLNDALVSEGLAVYRDY